MYKKLYSITKWDVVQVCKVGSVFKNQLVYSITSTSERGKKNHMVISIDAERLMMSENHGDSRARWGIRQRQEGVGAQCL